MWNAENGETKNRPYTKCWKGMTWNARALCHSNPDIMVQKYKLVNSWLHTNDFLIIQDTHMTKNKKSSAQEVP